MPSLATAPLHVLQLVGNGIVGGMESVVLQLLQRLPHSQFRLTVVCPFEGTFADRVRALGIDCLVLPMPDNPPWSAVQAVCALIESAAVDVLHAHLSNAHTLAALCGRMTGRPVLATIHGRHCSIADLELHRAAGTHLHTVCIASKLHALGIGVAPPRLHCINNGVDTTRFSPRARISSSDGELVVGFVGRLSPEKAPEMFVSAALLACEKQ